MLTFLFALPVPGYSAELEILADSVEQAAAMASQVHPEAVFLGIAAH